MMRTRNLHTQQSTNPASDRSKEQHFVTRVFVLRNPELETMTFKMAISQDVEMGTL